MYSQELLNYSPRHRTLFIRDEFLRTSEDLGVDAKTLHSRDPRGPPRIA